MHLFVGNILFSMTERELRDLLEPYDCESARAEIHIEVAPSSRFRSPDHRRAAARAPRSAW